MKSNTKRWSVSASRYETKADEANETVKKAMLWWIQMKRKQTYIMCLAGRPNDDERAPDEKCRERVTTSTRLRHQQPKQQQWPTLLSVSFLLCILVHASISQLAHAQSCIGANNCKVRFEFDQAMFDELNMQVYQNLHFFGGFFSVQKKFSRIFEMKNILKVCKQMPLYKVE